MKIFSLPQVFFADVRFAVIMFIFSLPLSRPNRALYHGNVDFDINNNDKGSAAAAAYITPC